MSLGFFVYHVLMLMTLAHSANPQVQSKEKLSSELVTKSGITLYIEKSMAESQKNLEGSAKYSGKNKTAIERSKLNSKVKDKFTSNKAQILRETERNLQIFFAKNFSESELSYLDKLADYEIVKKYTALLLSPEFNEAVNYPYSKISTYREEAKAETSKILKK